MQIKKVDMPVRVQNGSVQLQTPEGIPILLEQLETWVYPFWDEKDREFHLFTHPIDGQIHASNVKDEQYHPLSTMTFVQTQDLLKELLVHPTFRLKQLLAPSFPVADHSIFQRWEAGHFGNV